jgi:hypothetical protein
MTYENDPHNRNPARDNTSYTSWIIGGVVALAVVFGIVTMYRHNNNYTASNDRGIVATPTTTVAPVVPAPATNGSAVPTEPSAR